MCGIVGGQSLKQIDKETIKLLFLLAEERGGHATGFTDQWWVQKDAIGAEKFVIKHNWNAVGENNKGVIKSFIGHTRYATIGDKDKKENAHPWNFKKVLGVHNGSIYNHKELQQEENINRPDSEQLDFSVDSEFLYWMINTYGLKRTLPKLVGKVGLAYWDKRGSDRKDWILNLYRFDRPLSYGYRDGQLFYGSMSDYLETIGCEDIEELKENYLYQFDANGKLLSRKNYNKHSPKKKETEEKKSSGGTGKTHGSHAAKQESFSHFSSFNNSTTPTELDGIYLFDNKIDAKQIVKASKRELEYHKMGWNFECHGKDKAQILFLNRNHPTLVWYENENLHLEGLYNNYTYVFDTDKFGHRSNLLGCLDEKSRAQMIKYIDHMTTLRNRIIYYNSKCLDWSDLPNDSY